MRTIEQIVSELDTLKQTQIEEYKAHMICIDEAIEICFKYKKLIELIEEIKNDKPTMDNQP